MRRAPADRLGRVLLRQYVACPCGLRCEDDGVVLSPFPEGRPLTDRLCVPRELAFGVDSGSNRLGRSSGKKQSNNHKPSGSARPARRCAATTVLRSRQAMVMGPTPPGTGVIEPATSSAS